MALAASPAPSATPAPALVVHIKDFTYVPQDAEITVGDTVLFVNDDESAHTVPQMTNHSTAAIMEKGATWRYTFTKAETIANVIAGK